MDEALDAKQFIRKLTRSLIRKLIRTHTRKVIMRS
jgi:hypothetical protein